MLFSDHSSYIYFGIEPNKRAQSTGHKRWSRFCLVVVVFARNYPATPVYFSRQDSGEDHLTARSSVYFHHPAESPLSQEGRGWSVNTVRKSPAK